MLKYLLILYILISVSIFGVDILTSLVEDYSHFHMGRWNSVDRWFIAVKKVCMRWALHTPTLRIKKDCRYILIDKITGKYGKKMVQSWQKAGCILGITEVEENSCFIDIFSKIKKQLFDDRGSWRIRPNRIDYAMLAYAILRVEKQPELIKAGMNQMIECIENNICDDGLVSYSAGKSAKRRYVDTLGFVCPFLALYGKVYGNKEYIQMAINQILQFRKHGILNGLPFHCYETETNMPIGIWGWGRGVGWYTLALTDVYNEINEKTDKQMLNEMLIEVAEKCLIYEREEGGFSSILQAKNVYDSSATAMLGYFYANCGLWFSNHAYTEVAKRCLNQLMHVTKINGVIVQCQGDTIDIGILSEKYGSMPFVQGMALRLAAILHKGDEVKYVKEIKN